MRTIHQAIPLLGGVRGGFSTFLATRPTPSPSKEGSPNGYRLRSRAGIDYPSVAHGIYAYDAYYLECAVSHRAPLFTLDKGMRRVAQSLSLTVMELPT